MTLMIFPPISFVHHVYFIFSCSNPRVLACMYCIYIYAGYNIYVYLCSQHSYALRTFMYIDMGYAKDQHRRLRQEGWIPLQYA